MHPVTVHFPHCLFGSPASSVSTLRLSLSYGMSCTFHDARGPKLVRHKVGAASSRCAPIGHRRNKCEAIIVIDQSLRSVNFGPNFVFDEFRGPVVPPLCGGSDLLIIGT
ncbi:hypothetical protein ISCGN_004307 [Ixodes scapularis]